MPASPTPSVQPSSPVRLPMWLRLARPAAFLLVIVFASVTTYQLVTGPSLTTAPWATMTAAVSAVWVGLLMYGAHVRAQR
ncbi:MULTISPECIES: hypothetical protein [Streptomyces]|uniref:Uncharacterized protein n=2 Tax=Streptomyces TaxID=1883 RepID=A0ABT5G702_9ACTN|nr:MULTISPECIES: hypothetical protein [Streptomyces]MCA1270450.1 hypothetical protein [Streptomyces sp. 7G]MDC2960362.1 hypothetical protein [Streptomyces gilvifuscus]GHC27981.1 hypothetical protein GCM10010332_69690 [Streptomyces albogriseolus]GHE72119.1 hypothetical protein GCM10018782_52270 [Streptomyces griseoaurantiacus]